MLPRRQPPPSALGPTRSPHAARGGPRDARRWILGALAAVFVLGAYLNFRLLASTATTGNSSKSQINGPKVLPPAPAGNRLTGQLTFETRAVRHVAFTSGCAPDELVRAEVLADSARRAGYNDTLSHLVYGCGVAAFEDLQRRKNPRSRVESMGFPAIPAAATSSNLWGHGQLTTTLHWRVLDQWFRQELNRGRLADDDFVMLVESDAIFTKRVDVWNLFREVEDIDDPRWFGQDAAWYWPKRFPLSPERLAEVTAQGSKARDVVDWREFAATGPYVVEVAVLKAVLPTILAIWERLDAPERHLAVPIAAAHHELPIGISGVLNVHHYPSRYENWDFVDDIKHNPCNESAGRNVELESYPITIRASNFTLPQWIDGRAWSFFDRQLPQDLLACDAWLLREPTGYLWHLASHTNGYERVPTILRRRHTMSVCLALRAYNDALVAYKRHYCPRGFNENKKIPMEFRGATWPTALALAPATAMDTAAATRTNFGDYQTQADARAPTPRPGAVGSDDVHFVFVTGCSAAEQWQSDVLAHSFARVGQSGRLTRIVSGCTMDELKRVLARSALYPHLAVFATKNYATRPIETMTSTDAYPAYNRPFGLRDWLRDANPPVFESVIVILAPDFVFLRKFAVNGQHRVTRAKDADSENYQEHTEVIEGLRQYKRFFVYEGKRAVSQVSDEVKNGVAIAQRWTSYVGASGFDDATGVNAKVCPECKVTLEDALEYYAVGPPYVMAKHDLAAIVDDYGALTVKRRKLDANFAKAEMVGIVLAASKHNVRFNVFDNLAATGKDADDYWGFLDLIKENPCGTESLSPLAIAEGPPMLESFAAFKATDKRGVEWVFDKNLIPTNVFACDAWLLAVPPSDLWADAKKKEDHARMKSAYGVCTSIKILNEAIVAQRRLACPGGYNHNMRLRLVDPRPGEQLQIGRVHSQWEDAARNA